MDPDRLYDTLGYEHREVGAGENIEVTKYIREITQVYLFMLGFLRPNYRGSFCNTGCLVGT